MRAVSFSQFVQQLLHRPPKEAQAGHRPHDTWERAAQTWPNNRLVFAPHPPPPSVDARAGRRAMALWKALHIEDSLQTALRHGLLAADVSEADATMMIDDVMDTLRDIDFAESGAKVLKHLCSAYELRALPAALEHGLGPLRLALPGAMARAARRTQDPGAVLPQPNSREEVQRYARLGNLVDTLASPAGFGPLLPNNAMLLTLYDELDDAAVRQATEFYDSLLGSVYMNRLIPALNAWCAQFLERV